MHLPRIFRAFFRSTLGTVLCRCTGLAREMLFAFAFGVDATFAAFLLAWRVTQQIPLFLGSKPFRALFIPELQSMEEGGASLGFFCSSVVCFVLFLSGFVVIAEVGAFCVDGDVARWMVLLLPFVLLPGVSGLFDAYWNCRNRFFFPNFTDAIYNIVLCAGLLCSNPLQRLPTLIAIGLTIQLLAKAIPMLPQIWRERTLIAQHFAPFSPRVLTLYRSIIPVLIGESAILLSGILNLICARFIDPQGPAKLWYALRLWQQPYTLVGAGLAAVLLPILSKLKHEDRTQALQEVLKLGWRIGLFGTCLLWALGPLTVQLIYARGAFDATAVHTTTHLLYGYSIGLVPALLSALLTVHFYTTGHVRPLFISSCGELTLNILGNILFCAIFHLGLFGLTLATSIALLWRTHYLRQQCGFPAVTNIPVLTITLLATGMAWLVRTHTPFTSPILTCITTLVVFIGGMSALFLLKEEEQLALTLFRSS